jgi:hypothetical protein
VVQVVYQQYGAPVTDYSTGIVTSPSVDTRLLMLLEQYRTDEVDGVSIVRGDQRGVYWTSDLPAGTTVRDQVLVDGVSWAVVTWGTLGGGALTTLQLRRIGDV